MNNTIYRGCFVQDQNGKTGVVVALDTDGGVFRGHCDVWFGNVQPSQKPIVESRIADLLTPIARPVVDD